PLMLPGRQTRGGTEADRSSPSTPLPVQVVELVACGTVRFSGNGNTLACMAWFFHGDSVAHVPTIYDLGSDWHASYPKHARPSHTGPPATEPGGNRERVPVHLALSPNGRLAALTGNDPRILVFETRTGKTVWSVSAEAFGLSVVPTCLIFSPYG